MQTIAIIIGALILIAALIGFVRALLRTPNRNNANQGYGVIPGETTNTDSGGPGHGGGGTGHGA